MILDSFIEGRHYINDVTKEEFHCLKHINATGLIYLMQGYDVDIPYTPNPSIEFNFRMSETLYKDLPSSTDGYREFIQSKDSIARLNEAIKATMAV